MGQRRGSRPAKRAPVRKPRPVRASVRGRPGGLVLTGLVLLMAALVAAVMVQVGGGGGTIAEPRPSRPAAGPVADDSDPATEETPEEPTDVPPDVPEDEPDEPAAPKPRRPAPAPEPARPSGDDAPEGLPDDVREEPSAADPDGGEQPEVYSPDSIPEEPSEELLPDAGPAETYAGEADAAPFDTGHPADGEQRYGDTDGPASAPDTVPDAAGRDSGDATVMVAEDASPSYEPQSQQPLCERGGAAPDEASRPGRDSGPDQRYGHESGPDTRERLVEPPVTRHDASGPPAVDRSGSSVGDHVAGDDTGLVTVSAGGDDQVTSLSEAAPPGSGGDGY